MLIEHGADIKAVGGNGRKWTVLHFASRYGYFSVVEYLLNSGADVMVKDRDGKTPKQLASDNGHHLVADLLQKKDVANSESLIREKAYCHYRSKFNVLCACIFCFVCFYFLPFSPPSTLNETMNEEILNDHGNLCRAVFIMAAIFFLLRLIYFLRLKISQVLGPMIGHLSEGIDTSG